MIGILLAISRAELAKGPLLEVDEADRSITLLRENRIVKFADVNSILVLTGWYRWSSDWEKVAEMSLFVRGMEAEVEQVPILLHNNAWEVDRLAKQLADRIGTPIEQAKLTWKQRQSKPGP
jgi:hypothetical protein